MTATARRLKTIYGLAKKAGMTGTKGNENLHELVSNMFGKESLKKLTDSEYETLVGELKKRTVSVKVSNGITQKQISKIWQLMYELMEFDTKPSKAALGDRLCGIIKKELGIDALKNNPFMWLTGDDGSRLIEKLKKYVYSAEKKHSNTIKK